MPVLCRKTTFHNNDTIQKCTITDFLYLFQGFNARKVILEVYASFVLHCTVSVRECKHKTDVEA